MKIAWVVLLISALTNFIISAGGAMATASVETSWIPGKGAILVACITGLMQAARTIQEALKTVKLKVDLAGNTLDDPPPPPLRQLTQSTVELIAVKAERDALRAKLEPPAVPAPIGG